MKTSKFYIAVIISSLLLLGNLFSQSYLNRNKIPSKIKEQFHKEFPSSKIFSSNIKELNKRQYFQIESIVNHKLVKILYEKNGEKYLVEQEISNKDLPKHIHFAIKETMPGFQLLTSKKISKDKKTEYKVCVYKDEEEYNVIYSSKGKVKSKERIYDAVEMGC